VGNHSRLIARSLIGLVALALCARVCAEDRFVVPDTRPVHGARYLEITGDDRSELVAREWRVDGGLLLESTSSTGDRHLVLVDDARRTRAWRFESPGTATAVESVLAGGLIDVKGRVSGEPVVDSVPTEGALWIQSIERSLRDFVLTANDGATVRFAVLQPDTLKFRTLQARVFDEDDRNVAGRLTSVRRVRISLPGIGVLVWRSDYWFRMPDGLFVESRVTRGPPGTPETRVTLAEATGPAPR
jgi:hypothetical protein